MKNDQLDLSESRLPHPFQRKLSPHQVLLYLRGSSRGPPVPEAKHRSRLAVTTTASLDAREVHSRTLFTTNQSRSFNDQDYS